MSNTISAVLLPGIFEAQQTTIYGVNSTQLAANVPSDQINVSYIEKERTKFDYTTSVEFYILARANLNELVNVYQNDKPTDPNQIDYGVDVSGDDMFYMKSITITKAAADNNNPFYNLPLMQQNTIVVKKIDLYAISDPFKTFNYTVIGQDGNPRGDATDVEVTAAGKFYANAFYIGMDLESNANGVIWNVDTTYREASAKRVVLLAALNGDDLSLAQKIGIDYDTAIDFSSEFSNEDRDQSVYTITTDTFMSNPIITDKLTNINNFYKNTNILSDWTISFSAQPASISSNITKHGRAMGWRLGDTFFADGDKIVTDTAHNLTIQIQDVDGNNRTLIDNKPIYGVVSHSDSITSNVDAGYTITDPSPNFTSV